MEVVVVAASPGSPDFAVIMFGTTPPTVVMTPGSQGGNIVDCYGTLAVVGAYGGGGSVLLFDISAPLLPVQVGTVDTGFAIGSISTDGSYVLTGEFEASRVALIDIRNPASPSLVSVTDLNFPGGLGIIYNVALRMPNAVVGGDTNSLALHFEGSPLAGVPIEIRYGAPGACDFDGSTAVVAAAGISTYKVSGNAVTPLTVVPFREATGSVAVAEIPAGGYFVAAGGAGSFTVFAYPSGSAMGSLETSLQKSEFGTVVKFLNNPAIAPVLAVANVTASGVSISYYVIQVQLDPPESSTISFDTPNPVVQVALAQPQPTAYVLPTLGITAFTPKQKGGGGCFVATAAFGDANHPDVELLRRFRDKVLSQHELGRDFIAIYQRFGPVLAGFVMNRRMLRRASRSVIAAIVAGLRRFVD